MTLKRSCAALAWAVFFASSAFAQTVWHVDDGATPPGNGSVAQPFPDIASAIAAAVSGDTILVEDGAYPPFSFSGKDVAVRSANGPATTTIHNSTSSGNNVECTAFEGPGAVLEGFTVYGGEYGLFVTDASPTIRGCRFWGSLRGAYVGNYAGIVPGPTLEDSEIGGNVGFDGYSYFVEWTGLDAVGSVAVRGCGIGGNSGVPSSALVAGPQALGGGGAGVRATSNGPTNRPIFEDCFIANNAGGAGVGEGGFGGVECFGAEFRRCRIQDNAGGAGFHIEDPPFCCCGGGGSSGVRGWGTFSDCVIAGNVGGYGDAGPGQGGVYGGGAMTRCTVVDNGSSLTVAPYSWLTGTWTGCIVRGNGTAGQPPLGAAATTFAYCNVAGGASGVGNFDLPEFFVNAGLRDYRLTQFSPSVNAGDPATTGLGSSDVDGEPRVFGGRADVGADEHTGALVNLPPAAGNVGDATGANGPFDVLKINGTAGYSGRTVDVALGAPLTFELAAPPGVAGPFSYVLCGMFGVPNANHFFPSPFGTFLFVPAPADPLAPGFFTLASDVAFPSAPALVPTGPAPITVAVPGGLPFPLTVALQAAVVAGGPMPTDLRVSNGVVLRVY